MYDWDREAEKFCAENKLEIANYASNIKCLVLTTRRCVIRLSDEFYYNFQWNHIRI